MKKMLLLAGAMLAATAAHADYKPNVISRNFTTTVTANGGTNTAETPFASGPTYTAAYGIAQTGVKLSATINAKMQESFASQGGGLNSGSATGPFRVRLVPQPENQTAFTMTGANYVATGTVSGRELGISYTCYLTIRLNNLAASATFVTSTKSLVPGSGVVTYARDVSSYCNTGISWVPGLGAIADTFAERFASSKANADIDAYATDVVDKVIANQGGSLTSGLAQIASTVALVTQANGSTVSVPALMAAVQDGTGTIDMTLDTLAPVAGKLGVGEPPSPILVGTPLDFSVDHPVVGNVKVKLIDTAIVRWVYQCPTGSRSCQIP